MWNWLVSALFTGATVVLFDGSPGYPDMGALWRFAEASGATALVSIELGYPVTVFEEAAAPPMYAIPHLDLPPLRRV